MRFTYVNGYPKEISGCMMEIYKKLLWPSLLIHFTPRELRYWDMMVMVSRLDPRILGHNLAKTQNISRSH